MGADGPESIATGAIRLRLQVLFTRELGLLCQPGQADVRVARGSAEKHAL